MSLVVNRRNLEFMLYEVVDLDSLFNEQRFSDYDRGSTTAILDAAQQIAEALFHPCAAKLDTHEPEMIDHKAIVIPEVSEALEAYRDAGFFAASFANEIGGMQLPETVSTLINGIFCCANCGIANYAFLTTAAARMLSAFGSPEQKIKFLTPMVEGRWFGTMCLSEPQAGSSLSDIKTKAKPGPDNTYFISGSKMWISGGDQNLTENIIHMVLARLPDAPPGVKGLSLFIVPKHRVKPDGSLGQSNDVALAGLNHKMGQRGTTNTLLNFGEADACQGFLVGEPNEGLRYMFQMMNEARILVGQSATMSGLAGLLYSQKYATERSQGRHPQEKNPGSAQILINEHADIRRLLLAQKTLVEGAQCLVLYAANLIDRRDTSKTPDQREYYDALLGILTPIVKSWPSEYCLEANKHAIQVLGGYGYSREYPVERFYRDNRLNHIHEGTHAIHGIDLLGRQVRLSEGRAFQAIVGEMLSTCSEAKSRGTFTQYADQLRATVNLLKSATESAKQDKNLNLSLANATSYLDAFGHIVVAWLWLRQAIAAQQKRDSSQGEERNFYSGKLASCQYFFRYELPKVKHLLNLVETLDDTCFATTASEILSH